MSVGELRRTNDLLFIRVRPAVADVVANGAAEHMRLLEHIPQIALQPEQAPVFVILPIDQDSPRRRLVKAAEQVYDGAFSAARLTHQRDALARAHV